MSPGVVTTALAYIKHYLILGANDRWHQQKWPNHPDETNRFVNINLLTTKSVELLIGAGV